MKQKWLILGQKSSPMMIQTSGLKRHSFNDKMITEDVPLALKLNRVELELLS